MISPNERLTGILLAIGLILLVPLVAMQFTNEVNWTALDFSAAAGLLLIAGLGCEWVLRTIKKPRHRIVLCAAILAVFLLVWAELAVGIFGTPFAGR